MLSNCFESENNIVYVDEVFPDGWLRIRMDIGNLYIPEGTKLKLIEEKNGRQYFVILEGKFRGKKGSVIAKKNLFGLVKSSYLTTKNRRKGPAKLIFNKDSKKLFIKGLGKFNAFTDPDNPISNGSYVLEIPDEPHSIYGSIYRSYSNYSNTWFRIGRSGDRYLHCGRVSAGCLTVTELTKWTKIYKHLRYCRSIDGVIGIVTVE